MVEKNNSKIEFEGYNPFIKQLRADKGWRVEFDISQNEYDKIKDLPKVQGKILKISIKVLDKVLDKISDDPFGIY